MTEEPTPIAYTALAAGTPVQAEDGTPFGTVETVLDVPDLDVFDGLVVSTEGGSRFVDADQVKLITTSYVRCGISIDGVASLPEPQAPPTYGVDAGDDTGSSLGDRLGRLFGRGRWKRLD
ncbi:MAG: hypothetical protein WKF54_06370 [Nocardioidaceae bacterium]